ncbi:hypothetical protein ACFU98_28075 [Streptomyces sp. NPDC057575]
MGRDERSLWKAGSNTVAPFDGQDGIVGMIERLWAAEEMPFHDGL